MKRSMAVYRFVFCSLILAASTVGTCLVQAQQGLPPMLLYTTPAKDATGVSVNTTISFTFLSAMGPGHAIAWSSNVDPNNFTYTWSADQKTLTCTYKTALPANATITWQLNPPGTTSGFADTAGTPLTELVPGMNLNSGQFTTGSGSGGGTTNPCTSTNESSAFGCSVIKGVLYKQTSSAAPVIDPENGAIISALVNASTTNPVSSASLKLPNGSSQPLTNLFGPTFFLPVFSPFATQEALDAAYPNGMYSMSITRPTGVPLVPSLNLPANGYPPVPIILNYPQTQTVNPATDFVLQFNGLTAPTPNQSISVIITDTAGGAVFQAPDPCVPRTLANTATSVTIPAGTFSAGHTYDATLSYFNATTLDTNSIPGFSAFSGFSKSTRFTLSTGGGVAQTGPKFSAFQRMPDGTFQMQLTGQTGAKYELQYTTDWTTWTPVDQQVQTGNSVTFLDSATAGNRARFYRARVVPQP